MGAPNCNGGRGEAGAATASTMVMHKTDPEVTFTRHGFRCLGESSAEMGGVSCVADMAHLPPTIQSFAGFSPFPPLPKKLEIAVK